MTWPEPCPELRRNLLAGESILFAGPALATSAGLPDWYSLAQEMAERIHFPLPPRQWATSDTVIDLAQAYINQLGLHDLISFLRDRLNSAGRQPSQLHRALARLPLSLVVVASFDSLLEEAYAEIGKRVVTVVQDGDLPFLPGTTNAVGVVKLYGSLDRPDTIVLARQHYERYLQAHPLLTRLIETELARKDALYIGWTHSDPLFNLILNELRGQLGEYMRWGCAIALEDPPAHQRAEFRRKQIHVVSLAAEADPAAKLAEELTTLAADLPALTDRAETQERRIDAAMPATARFGERIRLLVQVRFPDSPFVGREDWPTKHKPEEVERKSDSVRLSVLIDPRSGQPIPARLRVQVNTQDFTVHGDLERTVLVPPDRYSKLISFPMTPTRLGPCVVDVEVYDFEDTLIGAAPVETTVGDVVEVEVARVASLVLNVLTTLPPTVADRRPQPATLAGVDGCPHCGAPTRPQARFCPRCGQRLGPEAPSAHDITQGLPSPQPMPAKPGPSWLPVPVEDILRRTITLGQGGRGCFGLLLLALSWLVLLLAWQPAQGRSAPNRLRLR